MKINTLKKLTLIIRCALVLSFVFLSTQVSYAQTCNDIVGPGPKVTNDTIILDIQSGTNDTTCFTLATPFATANDSLIVFTGAQYIGDSAYFFSDTCLVYQTVLSTVSRRDTLEIRLLLDGVTSCDTIIVLATVHGINDTLDTIIKQDSTYSICDIDILGTTADSVTICSAPTFGSTAIVGNCINYMPNLNYSGNDTMCVVACKNGLCDTTIVQLFIDPTPVIGCKDTTLYVDATGSITIDTSFVLDSVNDNNLDSVWLSQTTFGCVQIGLPTQVTIYAMDSLGQVDSCFANLTLIDTLAPAVVCQNITVQLDATGSVTIVANDVDNGTSDNCQLQTLIVSQSTFDCTMLGDNNVSLIATDIYGNVDSCIAIITVQDADAPVLSCPGDQQDEVAITCEYVIPDYSNLYSATDNCDDNVITYTQTPAPGTIVDADDQVVLITITAADTSGNIASCTFNLTLTCKKGVVIYDALTPNGDGDNETFIIDGIEEFPDATIKILNRWGNVVYESDKGYANDWDGTSNKGVTIGSNELPTGTYFYILDLGMEDFEGNQAFKGYIYLQR